MIIIKTENKSHYVYIKNFNIFTCNKSTKRVLEGYKEVCLKINGEQTVKLRSGSIKLKSCFKELVSPFIIYAVFKCIVRGVRRGYRDKSGNNTSYTEKDQDHNPCSFAYKVVYVDKNEKMQFIYISKQFLKSMIIAKK